MHPEIISISLFWFVTAFTPGPNNIVASYSGFNFGLVKTIPHILGVILGFTTLVFLLTIGLINVFKLYPIIQEILRYLGTAFLIYLAYKISFSQFSENKLKENS
jgi:threonine/homoserine/homoserine lactone efflux protein